MNKNKKNIKNKRFAEWGDMWKMYDDLKPINNNAQMPIMMSDMQTQRQPVDYNIAPQGEMQLQPQQAQPVQNTGNNTNNIGQGLQGIGKAAGQALNNFMVGAPQLINALLPEQQLEREDRSIQRSNNPYPKGLPNSQAIYENGGELIARDGYRERKRKKGNIQVTEEIPIQDINSFANNAQPQQFPVTQPQYNPQFTPLPEQPKKIQFEKLLDRQGNAQFSPIFSGNYTRPEAEQAMAQLPEFFGEIPVLRSPDLYRDVMQGFDQGSRGWDWKRTMFEDGGELDANSGIKINPKNKGKFTAAAKSRGMGVQEFASKVLANKEDYSPTLVKRANFAKNATKFNHKNGGTLYKEGDELDLSLEEIQALINQGYEIDY